MTVRQEKAGFVFTGRHMLATMVAFFGTIITVNFTMAYFAETSWSGLVVENTYVASQQFNGKAGTIRDMLASGIRSKLHASEHEIRYSLTMPDGRAVTADSVTAAFRRPVGEHQDFAAELTPAGNGLYVADHAVLPGHWIVEVKAVKDGKLIMHEATRIAVIGGRK
ncbi:FixH family protein [Rhizobium halophytocola]|uniref:Nitrogen fixation protein FixH n=1 Tax=Rhizobium halophytocola TaxID=735519 RepID=A0ABS4DZM3_9HYPH|nr:FixH family protein [Rhizobium halophytocola]MBP1851139.1 nitrogen fixation protein FixH [Rhizobium halophytocola]